MTQAQTDSRPAGHELICNWLGLPAEGWPPDHYTLLGLPIATGDLNLIEQRVHERLGTVRLYQLSHPDPATEAMNRIAQALVCLSDPAAKKAYDTRLLGKSMTVLVQPPSTSRATPAPPSRSRRTPPPPTVAPPPPSPAPAPPEPAEPSPAALPEIPLLPAEMAEQAPAPAESVAQPAGPPPTTPAPQTAAPVEEPERIDPNEEAGRTGAARRGIGSKRALYQRIVQTRRLIAAWDEAGAWMAYPKKKYRLSTDGPELTRLLTAVRKLARGFPVLGEAGQPGYFILGLARQPSVAETFRMYQASQREALARDWNAGETLLRSHAEFLRQEVRSMRRKNWWAWTKRASWSLFTDQPITILFLLGLLALLLAAVRTLATL